MYLPGIHAELMIRSGWRSIIQSKRRKNVALNSLSSNLWCLGISKPRTSISLRGNDVGTSWVYDSRTYCRTVNDVILLALYRANRRNMSIMLYLWTTHLRYNTDDMKPLDREWGPVLCVIFLAVHILRDSVINGRHLTSNFHPGLDHLPPENMKRVVKTSGKTFDATRLVFAK